MYVIGLTGGIASGKTTAADTLRQLGAQVIDADAISRALTAEGGAAAPAIQARFGTLDRKALGAVVFADDAARRDLNAIVHPLVQREMEAQMAASAAPVVVLDVPLLFEAGMEHMADEVWVVFVPKAQQIERIIARDGLSRADAIARIDSQMPTGEKLRRADVTIDTSGSFTQTRRLIEDSWHDALEKVGATHALPACETPIQYRRSAARRARQRRETTGERPDMPPTALPEEEEDNILPLFPRRARRVPTAPEAEKEPAAETPRAAEEAPAAQVQVDAHQVPAYLLQQTRRWTNALDDLTGDAPTDEENADIVAPDEGDAYQIPTFARPAQQRRTEPKRPAAWEDTSTLLEIPEQRTFFARQSPLFWAAAAILLVALLAVTGMVGVREWRAYQVRQAEAERVRLLEEERARYKLLYRDLIDSYAAAQGIPPALVAAVIYNESRFDPEAVSYLGARGLMQIMEDTGSWIAMRLGEESSYSFDSMFVPDTNIRYGTWYLGYLSRLFDGDMVKIAAGYHAGQNAVAGWLKNPEYSADGLRLDKIPYPDTEQYVQRVVNAYEIYMRHYYAPQENLDSEMAV